MSPMESSSRPSTRFLSGVLLLIFLIAELFPLFSTLQNIQFFSADDSVEVSISLELESAACCCCPVGSCTPQRCCCNGDLEQPELSARLECQGQAEPKFNLQAPLLTLRWWDSQSHILPDPRLCGILEADAFPKNSALTPVDPPPPRLS